MHHIIFLTFYCLFLYKLYPKICGLLDIHTPLFAVSDRQNYIVKNVIKAISLCMLVILSFLFLLEWDNNNIRIFASIYVANDLMGIVMCKHLPTSTRIHHMTTILFLIGAFMVDFQQSHVAQMLFYFTYASAISFPVNLYLGLRLCYEKEYQPLWLDQLRSISKYLYASVCVVSWSYQIFLFRWAYEDFLYGLMICFIIIDDIILMKWLFKK